MDSSYAYDLPGTISAVFLSRSDADRAYKALLARGYKEENISVLMSDETLNQHLSESNYHSEPESVPSSEESGLGKIIGGSVSGFLTQTLISFPSLGIAIAGPIVVKITEAKLAIAGALRNMIGRPASEEHSSSLEMGVREGGIIISVDPKNRAECEAIIEDFKRFDGQDILSDDGYSHEG